MNNNSLEDAIAHRRTYYTISNSSPVSDMEIEDIIKFAVKNVPSAFNSQSARLVLLLGKEHEKLWTLTSDILKQIVSADAFAATAQKIDSFRAGYGTVLYFEDQAVIQSFQKNFPTYADNFSIWSQQASGMHQFAVWTMLENVGFGASLQHYNPLIDEAVRKEWNLPVSWSLIAEMPFGTPLAEPREKMYQKIEERFLVKK